MAGGHVAAGAGPLQGCDRSFAENEPSLTAPHTYPTLQPAAGGLPLTNEALASRSEWVFFQALRLAPLIVVGMRLGHFFAATWQGIRVSGSFDRFGPLLAGASARGVQVSPCGRSRSAALSPSLR